MAAPAQMPRGGDTIKFEVGEPQIFALKFAAARASPACTRAAA